MKITFYLPGATNQKSGGYKVIYNYCNMLDEHGQTVYIVYSDHNLKSMGPFYKCVPIRKMLVYLIFGKRPRWFKLRPSVKVIYAFTGCNDISIPDADAVIATAVDTAEEVSMLSDKKGKKYYFVQGYEKWIKGEQYVKRSYRFPLQIITVSSYLKRRIEKSVMDREVVLVRNGIEKEIFYLRNNIEDRNPVSIAMLYHVLPNKGSTYGIEALKLLKNDFRDLEVNMFGTCKRPAHLPYWINYKRNMSEKQLSDLYNLTAIFLSPVIEEGFGLTGVESMACGCALVTSDFLASREYAHHMRNALVSPVKDITSLYLNMKKLILDQSLRIQLANNAVITADKFDIKKSYLEFEKILRKNEQ